jgi:hypothetical protein
MALTDLSAISVTTSSTRRLPNLSLNTTMLLAKPLLQITNAPLPGGDLMPMGHRQAAISLRDRSE